MVEQQLFPCSKVPVEWGNINPPRGTSVVLYLYGPGDAQTHRKVSMGSPRDVRYLGLNIACGSQQQTTEPRQISLRAYGFTGSNDQATMDELNFILEGALSLDVHEGSDGDIRAHLLFIDDFSERFFFQEGMVVFSAAVGMAK